jgi:hypothetical protein
VAVSGLEGCRAGPPVSAAVVVRRARIARLGEGRTERRIRSTSWHASNVALRAWRAEPGLRGGTARTGQLWAGIRPGCNNPWLLPMLPMRSQQCRGCPVHAQTRRCRHLAGRVGPRSRFLAAVLTAGITAVITAAWAPPARVARAVCGSGNTEARPHYIKAPHRIGQDRGNRCNGRGRQREVQVC